MAWTQDVDVGLGPAKPDSNAAEVKLLGGRGRSRRGYPAISCLFRGRDRTWGNSPTQHSEWCASEFQGRTPLSIHVEVECGRSWMPGAGLSGSASPCANVAAILQSRRLLPGSWLEHGLHLVQCEVAKVHEWVLGD